MRWRAGWMERADGVNGVGRIEGLVRWREMVE